MASAVQTTDLKDPSNANADGNLLLISPVELPDEIVLLCTQDLIAERLNNILTTFPKNTFPSRRWNDIQARHRKWLASQWNAVNTLRSVSTVEYCH
jgi:hypothetical protein